MHVFRTRAVTKVARTTEFFTKSWSSQLCFWTTPHARPMQELQKGQLEIISSKSNLLEKAIGSAGEQPFNTDLEEQYCLNLLLKTRQRAFSVPGFNFLCLTAALVTACKFFEATFFRNKIPSFASGPGTSVLPLGHRYKVSSFTRVAGLHFRVDDIVNI